MSKTVSGKWLNASTGEIMEMERVETKEVDTNFKKMWPKEIAEAASELSGSEMRIMLWMIATCDKRNLVSGTFRGLAESYGCADSVMSSAIASLRYADVIRRAGTASHMLNPAYIFQGGHQVRQKALYDYRQLPAPRTRGVKGRLPRSLALNEFEVGEPPAKIKARQQSALQKLDSGGRGAIPAGSFRQNVVAKLTGNIHLQLELIKSDLQTLSKTGLTELAEHLEVFTNVVLGAKGMKRDIKYGLLGKTAALVGQASASSDQRSLPKIRALDDDIGDESRVFGEIAKAWATVRPLLKDYVDSWPRA